MEYCSNACAAACALAYVGKYVVNIFGAAIARRFEPIAIEAREDVGAGGELPDVGKFNLTGIAVKFRASTAASELLGLAAG